jgi:hypothetical protein
MRAINSLALLMSGLAAVTLTTANAKAEDASSTNFLALRAELRQEPGPGQVPAERAYLTAGTERFSFLLPAGFRGRAGDAACLTLVTTNHDRVFTFRILQPGTAEAQPVTLEVGRGMVFRGHPGAKIAQEFSRVVDGRTGPAFDAEWIEPGGVARKARVAFIPARNSLLEFAMVCSPEKFPNGCQAMNTIFATFRASDEKGELHISPLSDRL